MSTTDIHLTMNLVYTMFTTIISILKKKIANLHNNHVIYWIFNYSHLSEKNSYNQTNHHCQRTARRFFDYVYNPGYYWKYRHNLKTRAASVLMVNHIVLISYVVLIMNVVNK